LACCCNEIKGARKIGHIISVGTGKNQLPLIKEIKNRGFNVVGFDLNEDSIGKKYCDFFKNISTWNYSDAIEWLKDLGLSYLGVGCFSYGNALVTQQKIANYFDLPGKLPEELVNLNNKVYLRKMLRANHLSTLNEIVIKDKCDFQVEKDRLYIVKPLVGGSSSDIKVYNNKIEGDKYNESYMLQEYISGKEYRISLIIQDSKIKFYKLMNKENLPATFFTSRFSRVNIEEYKEIELFLKKFLTIFNIKNAIMKIDLIKDKQRNEIIELDFGIPGDYFETYISKYFYNYDYVGNYINFILGLPVQEDNVNHEGKYSYFDYIYNISSNPFTIDYSLIEKKLSKYIKDFGIIQTKNDGDIIGFPKSNLDNICAVLHNEQNLDIKSIHELFFSN